MQLDWEPDPQQQVPREAYEVAYREVRVEENGPQGMGSIEVLGPFMNETILVAVSRAYMLIFMLSLGHTVLLLLLLLSFLWGGGSF